MTLGLFDLDNTLIDRRAMFARWASGMLERQQIDAPGALEWLIDVDGNGYGDKNRWMPLAAERFDVAEAAIAADREAHWVASIEVNASVGVALTRLADAGWVLGLVTNGPPASGTRSTPLAWPGTSTRWSCRSWSVPASPNRRSSSWPPSCAATRSMAGWSATTRTSISKVGAASG